jgi:hemoglobin
MKRTIFERYGGFSKISRLVMSFYDKILDSPTTSPYFANTDMRRLIDHQTRFMATIMGGPASYTNDQLERLHSHLKITNEAFLEAVNLLVETLEDYDFEDNDILLVKDEMMSRKNFIVASLSTPQEPA